MEAVSHKVELMCQEEKLFFQLQNGLLVILQLTWIYYKEKGAKKRKEH